MAAPATFGRFRVARIDGLPTLTADIPQEIKAAASTLPDMVITVKDNNIGRAADQTDRSHAGFFSEALAVAAIACKERLRFFSIKHQNPFPCSPQHGHCRFMSL